MDLKKEQEYQSSSGIRLYQCDCMELLKQTPDNYYQLACVDPPYGKSIDKSMAADSNTQRGASAAKRGVYEASGWDEKPPSQEYFDEIFRVSQNQIIWGANYFISMMPYDSPCWIVWDKKTGDNKYADCELAWTSFSSPVRMVKIRWSGMLQHDMKNKEKRIHPTQKPVRLYTWLFENYAKKEDKILDTHGGSFNSAIAAHFFGCEYTGCEINEKYYKNGLKNFKENIVQPKLNLL